mmetsp:Transcript_7774/g.22059  ORF Transcript_7774/g.22059 Transcript_7774/m.22059 type:complete len:205 (-) Transcript_7774:842-1456(-)
MDCIFSPLFFLQAPEEACCGFVAVFHLFHRLAAVEELVVVRGVDVRKRKVGEQQVRSKVVVTVCMPQTEGLEGIPRYLPQVRRRVPGLLQRQWRQGVDKAAIDDPGTPAAHDALHSVDEALGANAKGARTRHREDQAPGIAMPVDGQLEAARYYGVPHGRAGIEEDRNQRPLVTPLPRHGHDINKVRWCECLVSELPGPCIPVS